MARDLDQSQREIRQQAPNGVAPKQAPPVLSVAADEDVQPDNDAAEARCQPATEETTEVLEAATRRGGYTNAGL